MTSQTSETSTEQVKVQVNKQQVRTGEQSSGEVCTWWSGDEWQRKESSITTQGVC